MRRFSLPQAAGIFTLLYLLFYLGIRWLAAQEELLPLSLILALALTAALFGLTVRLFFWPPLKKPEQKPPPLWQIVLVILLLNFLLTFRVKPLLSRLVPPGPWRDALLFALILALFLWSYARYRQAWAKQETREASGPDSPEDGDQSS